MLIVLFVCALLIIFVGAWRKQTDARSSHVSRQLTVFTLDLQNWMGTTGRIPGLTLAESLRQLAESKEAAGQIAFSRYPVIFENRDPWGHSLVYEVRQSEGRIVVRSVGRNGLDEYGKGDDIQAEAILPATLRP